MADKLLKYKKRKGQSLIEITFVIIIFVLLLGGITNIWIWANKQIVKRQVNYGASRVRAGTSSDSYILQWPIYTPESLTEDKVILQAPQ